MRYKQGPTEITNIWLLVYHKLISFKYKKYVVAHPGPNMIICDHIYGTFANSHPERRAMWYWGEGRPYRPTDHQEIH